MGWPTRLVARVRATTDASGCRRPAGSSTRSTTFTGSTCRSSASASPRNIDFVAKVEAHRVPGLGQLHPLARHDRRPARRVRPRRRAADARGGARRRTSSASSSRGRARRAAVPGTAQPGRRDGRDAGGRAGRSRSAVYGTQFWRLGNFAPCSVAFGEPIAVRRAAAGRPGLQGGDRARSSAESTCSWTGSPTCTHGPAEGLDAAVDDRTRSRAVS